MGQKGAPRRTEEEKRGEARRHHNCKEGARGAPRRSEEAFKSDKIVPRGDEEKRGGTNGKQKGQPGSRELWATTHEFA